MRISKIGNPINAQFEKMSLQRFGALLLGSVYEPLSAYAILDPDDRVTAFKLFDTAFGSDILDFAQGKNVVLFSNHPTGNTIPTADDLRNAELLKAKLYIVCESSCVIVKA